MTIFDANNLHNKRSNVVVAGESVGSFVFNAQRKYPRHAYICIECDPI